MRIINLTIAPLLAVFNQTFARTGENAILGKWESDKKDVRLEFYNEGDEYQARLLWGNNLGCTTLK